MTLERLLCFYRRSNRPRYATRISKPIVARRVATRLERGSRILKRTSSLQAPQDTWPRTQNVNLTFNRAASLQQGEVCVSTTKTASLRATSPLDVRVSSISDEVCVSKTTRPSRLQDLCSVSTSTISLTVY